MGVTPEELLITSDTMQKTFAVGFPHISVDTVSARRSVLSEEAVAREKLCKELGIAEISHITELRNGENIIHPFHIKKIYIQMLTGEEKQTDAFYQGDFLTRIISNSSVPGSVIASEEHARSTMQHFGLGQESQHTILQGLANRSTPQFPHVWMSRFATGYTDRSRRQERTVGGSYLTVIQQTPIPYVAAVSFARIR